jgi:hypothetical protein
LGGGWGHTHQLKKTVGWQRRKEKGESKEKTRLPSPLAPLEFYYFFWHFLKARFSLALLAIVVKIATIAEDS